MANRATEFYDALRAACVAAIPALGVDGVVEARQIEQESAEIQTLPYLVIETQSEEEDADFCGLNNIAWRVILNLWLVRSENGSDDALRDDLYTLERYLTDNALADGQVLWPRAHLWDPASQAVSVAVNKLLPWVVGGLQIEATYGETY